MKVTRRMDGGLSSDNPKTPVCAWQCDALVADVQMAETRQRTQNKPCTIEEARTLVYRYFLVVYAVYKEYSAAANNSEGQPPPTYPVSKQMFDVWVLHRQVGSYADDWEMYLNHRHYRQKGPLLNPEGCSHLRPELYEKMTRPMLEQHYGPGGVGEEAPVTIGALISF